MATYTWDFVTAQQTIEVMESAYRDLETHLSDMENQVEKQVEEWTGGGKEAYGEAKGRWHAAANRMNSLLGVARSELSNISDGMSAAEQKATSMWSGSGGVR